MLNVVDMGYEGLRRTAEFSELHEYRVESGYYADGNSAANTFCMHWLDDHPE